MEEFKITMHNEEETIELAQNLESEKFPNMVICLYGDLGSGKTVFAKAFADAMGIEGVTSSTFNIIKDYLPEERLDIKFKVIDETTRVLILKAYGDEYIRACEDIL